ncbi:MAG: ABC transporter permease [Gemmatimonadota bacterium]|nr:ABC transporter permease [Gemmatimonadota bacterium]
MRGAILAVVEREFKRFLRQRGRLLSTFARPLLWLAVIGSGFAALVPEQEGLSYHQYLLPGIFGMVLLFSSMLSALSTVHDREFGPVRMMLVAPLPRGSIVAAKVLSSTLLAVAQGVLLLPLLPLLGLRPGPAALAAFLGALLLTAVALSSLGMLLASRIRSLENFAGVMNLVIFPMFFLSGALYPVFLLPGYLKPLVYLNPLTYGVDLLKHPLLSPAALSGFRGEFSPALDVSVLLGFSVLALAAATFLFGGEEHAGRILLSETPRRRPRRS